MLWADQGELTKLPGIAAALRVQLARRVSLLHWEWCTINNELRTTSGRRVLGGRPRHGWVLATAATGRRQRPHLWVQTVAEGVVPPKEGCQAVRVLFRFLFGVARPAC